MRMLSYVLHSVQSPSCIGPLSYSAAAVARGGTHPQPRHGGLEAEARRDSERGQECGDGAARDRDGPSERVRGAKDERKDGHGLRGGGQCHGEQRSQPRQACAKERLVRLAQW